jgi:hypothetical protein
VRRPFEKLVELVDGLSEEEQNMTLGELGARWNEAPQRIMDALDASKMMRGKPTYIPVAPDQ